ncbi:MAG: hypothetical protein M1113_02920 [Candidatus Thermoplasmatota archaeon]|nr:hypothetical protein [Candidatus Thermoplasmatota archaeon]
MGEKLLLVQLRGDIAKEEEKLRRYCRRCSYQGKKVLMHTASVQWTDQEHVKHFTPILRVCPECRDIRWLPNQYEKARRWGGFVDEPHTWTDDEGVVHKNPGGISRLEYGDLMAELGIIRERLRLIKEALYSEGHMYSKNQVMRFDWKQFIKIYLDGI